MTPPLILIKAASILVGNRLAKAGAWVLIGLAVLSLLWLGKCTYDARLIDRHEARVTEKTLTTDNKAKDAASRERATDTIAINQAEKEREDAIAKGPAGRPDDARVRLNCERLRRAGFNPTDFPECR